MANFYLSTPAGKTERVIDFPKLSGGLNLYDLAYRMAKDESPEMKNLHWKDGALGCRPGQMWATDVLGAGFTCYEQTFWDHAFIHVGTKLYSYKTRGGELTELYDGLKENRGTFFRYRDKLYYKNRGGYVEISYNEDGSFTAADVAAYTPVTYINMNPTTHAGTAYQPENRLSPSKTLWYDAEKGVSVYHLPEQNVEGVSNVSVDGVLLAEGTDYSVDLAAGTVTFNTAPPVSDPFYANTVKLTYTKSNEDMYTSVMNCCYAAVFGGGNQNICIVMGGCPAQPNAYFWNGNHVDMDAGYFPAEQYNLAGDTADEITAFGKQQNMLVIFKARSVGRITMDTTTAGSDRLLIEMPYTAVNSQIGCDLPWSVQLVENNLVFCNSERGVHMVLDSSSVYENNIVCLSKKVNGSAGVNGLLKDLRNSARGEVCSFDDGANYWIVANTNAYLWDYQLSDRKKPSWFFYTNILATSFFRDNEDQYHLNAEGRLTRLSTSVFSDYGEAIEKIYQFPIQNMGSYDRLKDVRSAIFVVRSTTNSEIQIRYDTDYEKRYDLTPISAYAWSLVPRDLSYRYLGVNEYAHVERRAPMCRHIKHFGMRLENKEPGQDLSIISAQLFYNFQGRYR